MRLRVGLHRSRGILSSLIKWQTRSEYSHASLVLPDDSLLEALQGHGVIHSRTLAEMRDPVDVYALPDLDDIAHANALEFARQQLGKPYDYLMVARFVTRRQETRRTSGKWFCSELVYAAFAFGALRSLLHPVNVEPWQVSPETLSYSPLLVRVP